MLRTLSTVLRSGGVGVAATLVDLGALTVLVSGLGWLPAAASVPALLLGVIVQFVGSKWVTFRDHSPRWVEQGLRFLGVEAVGLSANAVLFPLLTLALPWPYQGVRLLTTSLVYCGVCLPLWWRIFVSGTPPPS